MTAGTNSGSFFSPDAGEYRRLAGLFRENGMVFSMTIDPEMYMKIALSCDASDETEIARAAVMSQYPYICGHPELVRSVALEDGQQCVVSTGYGRSEPQISRTVAVELDTAAFGMEIQPSSGGYMSVTVLSDPSAGFLASRPSPVLVESLGTADFMLVQSDFGGFFAGSTALQRGFALALAPTVDIYRRIFEAQAERMRRGS